MVEEIIGRLSELTSSTEHTATIVLPGRYTPVRSGRQITSDTPKTPQISQITGCTRMGWNVRRQTRSWRLGQRFESARRLSVLCRFEDLPTVRGSSDPLITFRSSVQCCWCSGVDR